MHKKKLLGLLSLLVLGCHVQAAGASGDYVYEPGKTLMRVCGIKPKCWGTAKQSKANAEKMAKRAQRARAAEALREKERTEHKRYYANRRRELEQHRQLAMQERVDAWKEVRKRERELAGQKVAKKFRAYLHLLDTTIEQRVSVAAYMKKQKGEALRGRQAKMLLESRRVRSFAQEVACRRLAAAMSAARARRAEAEYQVVKLDRFLATMEAF